jgi:hypothetical protein
MIDRGIQPKGFYNDDAARLQEEFNREHEAEKEARMQQKVQLAARSYLKETVHRRRQERERELREEVDEVARNPQLEVWLGLAKAHDTPAHATLRVNNVGTRALCKALAFTHSLRSLSLSRNALDDSAGKWIALLVKRSSSLTRLELESNCLGAQAARDMADALCTNASVAYLNLESNPLTDDEKDFSGVAALGDMLACNSTLRALNVWRTRLGGEGGKHLARGMESNATLVCLDVGNNRISNADAVAIDRKLRRNRGGLERTEDEQQRAREAQAKAADKERERQMDIAKHKDYVRCCRCVSGVEETWRLTMARVECDRRSGWSSASSSESRTAPRLSRSGSARSRWRRTGCGRSQHARRPSSRRAWSSRRRRRRRAKARREPRKNERRVLHGGALVHFTVQSQLPPCLRSTLSDARKRDDECMKRERGNATGDGLVTCCNYLLPTHALQRPRGHRTLPPRDTLSLLDAASVSMR